MYTQVWGCAVLMFATSFKILSLYDATSWGQPDFKLCYMLDRENLERVWKGQYLQYLVIFTCLKGLETFKWTFILILFCAHLIVHVVVKW